MYDDLRDHFAKTARSLRARAVRGELLVLDDLFVSCPATAPDVEILCLDGILSGSPNDLEAISPGLSFRWSQQKVDTFGSSDRLKRCLTEFRNNSGTQLGEVVIGGFTYLFTPRNAEVGGLVRSLALGVKVIAQYSLNSLNKYQDQIDGLNRELMLAVGRVEGRFGLLELAEFLDRETGLDFGLLHITDAPDTPLGRTITISTASATEATLRRLEKFLRLPPAMVSEANAEIRNPFPAVPLPQSVGAELIVNAGSWGKPMVGGHPVDGARRLLVIPITRQLGPRANFEEQVPLASTDLLFTFLDEVQRGLIDRLKACVDTFSSYRYGARRFNLLAKMQTQRFDIANSNPRSLQIKSAIDFAPVGTLLEPLLNEVLYTTSAHSVSVRVYDPMLRALRGVAAVASVLEKNSTEASLPSIEIKKNSRTSVVAFTFLNAGPNLPFTYLRRISPPIRRDMGGKIKTDHRTFIPPEYKMLGLQAPMIRRSMTRSEICFPLMKGRLAFGTFNLEAPYPSAFDQDKDYLNLVKMGIEKLYALQDEQIDGRWLITSAARSDSVHQLWQYQEEGSFFSASQDKLLRAIFPRRSEHAPVSSSLLSVMKKRVQHWIRTRYEGSLREDVLRMVKFDHVEERAVDGYYLEAVFVIVRNLIQNSVKHGEPDKELLFIDDRPWFGARRIPCVRVHYRSNQSVPPGLLEKLGRAPIRQDEGKRIGYGMYNVGLLCRLLGGNLHVTEQGENNHLVVEIHLPVVESRL
jgi:hypothetical protein